MKDHPDISNEELLLPGLCRLSFTEEHTDRLKALAGTVADWKYFISLASGHGVAALAYYNLEKLGLLQHIPSETKDILRNTLMISLSRNTRNAETMTEVLGLMTRNNIKCVLLKGLALELMVYGNSGIRQMTDIDVLMTREDCLKAMTILLDNGFNSFPLKSLFHRSIMSYIGKHLPTLSKDSFRIELHHELFTSGNKELTRIFYDSSSEAEMNGEKAFLPEPQIFFLYLIKHLNMHEMNNESQLRLYTDLVVLIEKYREDILTDSLIWYAEKAGMREILARKLGILRDFWDISLPDYLNELILGYYDTASFGKFIFFLKSPKDNPPLDQPGFYRNIIREIPGFHRKLLFISGDLFPTLSFMKKRYRCAKGWHAIFFYPFRWGKLWYLIKKN
ncbi:MAG: nucleotidyltransferase family protein [Bacteroidales bacterium]|nr:nucleotidyltransferase family protein [Bacteroidales bacterium]